MCYFDKVFHFGCFQIDFFKKHPIFQAILLPEDDVFDDIWLHIFLVLWILHNPQASQQFR